MSKVTTTWKDVKEYLKNKELTREQRIDLFNYFNKEINSFPFTDVIQITSTGGILANGKALTLEQREAFLTGARSLMANYAFQVISDQVMYLSLKKGIHDSVDMDHVYFSKTALFMFDMYKKYLEKLDQLS